MESIILEDNQHWNSEYIYNGFESRKILAKAIFFLKKLIYFKKYNS